VAWQFSGAEETRERTTLKVIAPSFFALAAYVTFESVRWLTGAEQAEYSPAVSALAALSLLVVPFLSAAQRRAGREPSSVNAVADSEQTGRPARVGRMNGRHRSSGRLVSSSLMTVPTVRTMVIDLTQCGSGFLDFWTERHLCTLSTPRADGTPHVIPVGVTLDVPTATARVITFSTSYKARLVRAAGADGIAVAVCQFDGGRWSTLEGRAVLRDDPVSVRDAEQRYAQRYRTPKPNPLRVVLEIAVTRVLGNA
jgi:PPOX class probable F420-dependent enzyme